MIGEQRDIGDSLCPLLISKTAKRHSLETVPLRAGRLSFHGSSRAAISEKEGDRIKAGQADHGVNNPAYEGHLAAEDAGHQIVTEESDQAPVYRADND